MTEVFQVFLPVPEAVDVNWQVIENSDEFLLNFLTFIFVMNQSEL